MASVKPNIILITTDQQRYDSVNINGSSFMHTPNMNRIGNEGAAFDRAYCPNTVCTPSRVSLMSGLHLSRHGAYNIGTFAPGYDAFLSTILRDHGYRTHHIGKAHWHPFWADSPENQKVDEQGTPFADFAGFETAEPAIGHTTFGVTGFYEHWVKQKGFDPATLKVDRLFEEDANDTGNWNLPVELHNGHWIAERAIDFLEGQEGGDRPFFLNLGFQDPHHPHVLPYDFHNRLDPDSVPLPDSDVDSESGHAEHIPLLLDGKMVESRFNGQFVIAGNVKAAWRPYFKDEEKTRATRAYYYSMVQLIDEQLGRILEAVDRLGMRDNTLLIFTTDHGEMLGDHSIGQKGPMIYEGVAHIPLLLRYPNGFGPCRVEDCVSLIDMLPTVLDFAGIDDGMQRDGVSLKNRLQDGEVLERNGVRIEFKEEPDRIRFKCWVTPEWKLAVYTGETFGELYHLKADPGEKHNLFDVPEYQSVKAQLLIEMLNDMERSEPLSRRPCRA